MPCSSVFDLLQTTPASIAYTLSLHDALPIYRVHGESTEHGRQVRQLALQDIAPERVADEEQDRGETDPFDRSEEHTSELQSLTNLVCRLLLEQKKEK